MECRKAQSVATTEKPHIFFRQLYWQANTKLTCQLFRNITLLKNINLNSFEITPDRKQLFGIWDDKRIILTYVVQNNMSFKEQQQKFQNLKYSEATRHSRAKNVKENKKCP